MSTTLSLPLAPASSRVPAQAGAGSVGLAELLAEVGTALEPLAVESLPRGPLAALTAHLVDGAGTQLALTPEGTSPAIVSLRALGVLAARTAGTEVAFPATRAAKVRALLTDLTAA